MTVGDALKGLYERIDRVCRRIGRDPAEVRLMGVSKFHGPQALEAAWQGGLRLFGESRVQEAEGKFPGFIREHPGTELHLIGSLQRNKARRAASLFDCIQSVDRNELITELGALTVDRDRPLMILLELHTGEDSKSGYPGVEQLLSAAETALAFPNLSLEGLMTIAPYTEDREVIRASFRALASARDQLRRRFPEAGRFGKAPWSCLSMGMSGDFEIALEEGSTLLRIGTAIFGERTYG
ncbi:MAG: YggS family pyridoxal phosphate-dependent enzyme [Spirochaetaceae bacterium]|jgi:pyridoxal phosphate enzyme (YggS family)|nr:YggS family pyridoxal phosphate-dependent enzyme [Spirochaetaceae bacterium]